MIKSIKKGKIEGKGRDLGKLIVQTKSSNNYWKTVLDPLKHKSEYLIRENESFVLIQDFTNEFCFNNYLNF